MLRKMASRSQSSPKSNRRREMECAICLERLHQPKILSCSHNFCGNCLESLVQDQKINCPVCRKHTTLGTGGVADLPKNIALASIMNTLCEQCLYEDRKLCCDDCGLWMCSDCSDKCKEKQDFSDQGKSFMKDLLDPEKKLFDHKMKLTESFELARDQIEAQERKMIKSIRLKGESLRSKLQLDQNRHMNIVDKLTKSISDHRNEIKDRLANDGIGTTEITKFLTEWNKTTKDIKTDISQLDSTVQFVEDATMTEHGNMILKPNYKYATFQEQILGSEGSDPEEFDSPTCVAISPVTKTMVVLDSGNKRIQLFNEDHEFILEFGDEGDGEGEFDFGDKYGGLAVTDDCLIIVADTNNNRLQVFTEGGEYVRSIGSAGTGSVQFDKPRGLAIHDDHIYVCDSQNYRVQVLKVGGRYVRQFGSKGVFSSSFPINLAIRPNGDFIVSCSTGSCGWYSSNGTLVVFKTDGKPKATYAPQNTGSIKLHIPSGIATTNAGDIVVSDYKQNSIYILTRSGELLRHLGTEGEERGQLSGPMGLVTTNDGRIIVADCKNNRVQVFSLK